MAQDTSSEPLSPERQLTEPYQNLGAELTWQKLCPQGVETGSVNRSRQMEQVSSCSEKSSCDASAIVRLLQTQERVH